MTPEFIALCQRAKAAKHFAWEPGMRVFVPGTEPESGLRVLAVRGEGDVPDYALPDMSDGQTIDCLRASLVKRMHASRAWIHIDLRDGATVADRLVAMMQVEP